MQEEFPNLQVLVHASSIVSTDNLQDEIKPSDSVSNVGSRTSKINSSSVEKRSVASSTSSVRLKAEAELAALMAQQKLLKDKHELEDQEEQLRKRKERLNLEGEIAIQMAKLNVLKSQSVSSSNSDRSGGKHHNLVKEQKKIQSLNASAKSFVPQVSAREKGSVHERLQAGARPKEKSVQQRILSQPHPVAQQPSRCNSVEQRSQGNALNSHVEFNNEEQNNMLGIMRKQNEITKLLLKPQCLSSLPKKDLNMSDGDPLHYSIMHS